MDEKVCPRAVKRKLEAVTIFEEFESTLLARDQSAAFA